jgi:glutamyl-tRNA reductase
MRLQCLGLNHHTANVDSREKLAFSTEMVHALWDQIRVQMDHSVTELVVMSTCNRVELYLVSDRPAFEQVSELLAKQSGLPIEELEPLFYRLVDEQVVSHLFRVAAGLDSMVLGEPQILGQVTEAYEAGLQNGSCGKVLSKLFQSAIYTGKRVRTETEISKNSVSISSLAATKAEQVVKDLSQAQITLLGAGEMAELAIEALRKRGADQFIVISRTISSACGLAEKWNGHAGTIEKLTGALEETDILITSTSAPHTLIHRRMIEQVMAGRPDRPMVIIDIAVPRDVASDVGEIEHVSLYDIDGLNRGVEKSIQTREGEIPQVEQIIDQEYRIFKDFYASLKVVPVIVGMRRQADEIRRSELEKTLRKLDRLDPHDQEQIAALTHSIVQKILHEPTIRLREEANGPNGEKYAGAVRALFGLEKPTMLGSD